MSLKSLFSWANKKDKPETRAMGMRGLREQISSQVNAMDDWEAGLIYYLVDIYLESGSVFAIITSQGRLYRADVTMNGNEAELDELVPVTEVFVPTANARTVTRVFEQEDGTYRWLSISSTAIMNRDMQLDTTVLFDSFVAYAQEHGEYPYRRILHADDPDDVDDVLRTGQADFVARDGYCLITSGVFFDTPLARAERLAIANNPDYWGESIGFFATQEPAMLRLTGDLDIEMFESGRLYEIATAPEHLCSSWFTTPLVVNRQSEEKMNKTLVQTISQLIGDANLDDAGRQDLLAQLEGRVDRVNDHASQPGTVARTATSTQVETAEDDEQVAETAEDTELVIDDSVIEAVVERVVARIGTGAGAGEATVTIDAEPLNRIKDEIMAEITRIAGSLEDVMEAANTNFELLDSRLVQVEAVYVDEQEALEDMPPARRTVVYRPSMQNDANEGMDTVIRAGSDELVQEGLAQLPKSVAYAN